MAVSPMGAISVPTIEHHSIAEQQAHATLATSTNDDEDGDAVDEVREDNDDDDEEEQVTDSSRIWSAGVLLQLVHVWRRVELARPQLNRVEKSQLVYDEFNQKVECSSTRSRKAVEDKLYSMKQMYRFILEMNRDFQHRNNSGRGGSASSSGSGRSWFELTKQERRAVRCAALHTCLYYGDPPCPLLDMLDVVVATVDHSMGSVSQISRWKCLPC